MKTLYDLYWQIGCASHTLCTAKNTLGSIELPGNTRARIEGHLIDAQLAALATYDAVKAAVLATQKETAGGAK